MQEPLRGYAATVLAVWIALAVAAIWYSQQQNIPSRIAIAVVPAFLLEAALYIACGMAPARRWLEQKTSPLWIAVALTASAAVPYAIYSAGTGLFRSTDLLGICALAGASSFWYVLLRPAIATDTGFLILLGSIVLAKTFDSLYPTPWPKVTVSVLGMSMLVRTGIVSVLSIRRMEGINFGLLPRRCDWLAGLKQFALFLPLGMGLGLVLRFMHLPSEFPEARVWVIAVLTFFGVLWLLAAGEEFFFRGMLQPMLTRAGGPAAGLVLTSILFGLVHLPFRQFPNWRFALLAALAGLFYGRAYMETKSVRAAMVAHAFVVTTWRVFLS